jgi:hypothetical protein
MIFIAIFPILIVLGMIGYRFEQRLDRIIELLEYLKGKDGK